MAPKESRRDRTARLTAQAMAWMWKSLDLRIMALEVGYNPGGIATAWNGLKRADLVGVAPASGWQGREFNQGLAVWVVEVKSTYADWSREDDAVGKWRWPLATWCLPIVVADGQALAHRIHADMGEESQWHVAWFTDQDKIQWASGARRKPNPPIVSDPRKVTDIAMAMAAVQTAGMMPAFANSQRAKEPLSSRIQHKVFPRHICEQIDLFD